VLLLAGRPAGTENAVKALAYDLGLRNHVRFLGDVDDVTGLIGAIELAVLSSRSELFGRAVTEPMRAGLPVVGTDVPGIREAVGDTDGAFLAAPGDAAALADPIVRLARDPLLRARAGKVNAEMMRARHPAEATSHVYAELLAAALAGRANDPQVSLEAAGGSKRRDDYSSAA
jgi:glycosyltransferase involved in cell wall biosynthesis